MRTISERRDARRNRAAIVAVAAELLRQHGLDAPLDEIARRARVGNATLYRHFPTRDDLYEAVFADAAQEFRALGERALRAEDGWRALIGYVEQLCLSTAADPQLHAALQMRQPGTSVISEIRRHADAVLESLLHRAQQQGAVRPDVEIVDLILLIVGIQRVVALCSAADSDAWRRQLALLTSSLRADPALDELPELSLDRRGLADSMIGIRPVGIPTSHRAGQVARRARATGAGD